MPEANIHVSDLQLVVMRALWALGPATTASVYQYVGQSRTLAYTTVATVLTRLEKPGLVRSVKQDGERVFEALVSENDVAQSMVSSLVASLFRGDPSALVSHLVRGGEVGEKDLDKVRKLLAKGKDDE